MGDKDGISSTACRIGTKRMLEILERIVDGKGAVTFLVRVKEALEDPRRLLMDL